MRGEQPQSGIKVRRSASKVEVARLFTRESPNREPWKAPIRKLANLWRDRVFVIAVVRFGVLWRLQVSHVKGPLCSLVSLRPRLIAPILQAQHLLSV